MHRFIEVVDGDDLLSPETAKEALALLAPLLEVAPADEEALAAMARIIGRIPTEELVGSVADWWLVVTTGHPSVNSRAYMLPDELGPELASTMKALVEINVPVPPSQWLEARRRLDRELEDFEEHLHLDHYGRSKLPSEREAWSVLLQWLDPSIEALRSNRRAPRADYEERRFQDLLKSEGVDEGSRRWKEMRKRAQELTGYLNQLVELQAMSESWKDHPIIGDVENVPSLVQAALDPVTDVLLRPVLGGGPGPSPHERTIERLEVAAGGTDDAGRVRLARIAHGWLTESGRSAPSLTPIVEQLDRLERALAQLEDAGQDTDEPRLLLIDGDLQGAVASLERVEQTAAESQKSETLDRQVRRLQDRIAETTPEDPAAWEARLAEINELRGSGRLREAEAALGRAESDLASARRHGELQHARHLLDELERLAPPDSVLFDRRAQLDTLDRDPGRRLPADLVTGLGALVDDYRGRRAGEVDTLVNRASGILTTYRSEFDETAIADLELLLTRVRSEMDAGEPRTALATAQAVLDEIDARRVHRWTSVESEAALVDHLVSFCTADLDFDEDDVKRLHVALKTKPFVILAGLTGSGKSTIARLYAEALGATSSNGRFRRVAVRPDWIDQAEVLGYVNPISNRFQPGWLAETIRDCEQNPQGMYFVLLDEMNLAPVEQYLAEFLSALEEARSGSDDVRVPLYARGADPENGDEWAPELTFPPNLFLIGSVNVDETTRPLSDRVIDRANVLQLNVSISDRHHLQGRGDRRPWLVSFDAWCEICHRTPSDRHHDLLVEVADILRSAGIGVGVRSHIELERFIANSEGVLDDGDALDWGVLQRIVPKIRGFKSQLEPALVELADELESAGVARSSAVVRAWLDPQVSDEEFLDGSDHKIALVHV